MLTMMMIRTLKYRNAKIERKHGNLRDTDPENPNLFTDT